MFLSRCDGTDLYLVFFKTDVTNLDLNQFTQINRLFIRDSPLL